MADLEQGTAAAPASKAPEPGADAGGKDEFNQMYYYVYVFSLVIAAVGIGLYFFGGSQNSGIDGMIAMVGMLVTGIFLVTQSDLIVTYFRLQKETGRFKENNKKFKENLKAQKAEIQKLKRAEKAFEKLNASFGGSLEKAEEELGELEASARDKIGQGANQMLMMYAANKERNVPEEELDSAVQMLGLLYCRIYKDFKERMDSMKEAIRSSERFKKAKGLEADRLGKVFRETLGADEVKDVPDKVHNLMIEKGRNTIAREFMAD